MYNVLEKLRAGEELNEKDQRIHEQGLVSVLKQIHDELDAAVFAAYGWPTTLTDEQILERLVALNAERAAEEARGLIRWLRPEFQNPASGERLEPAAVQQELELPEEQASGGASGQGSGGASGKKTKKSKNGAPGKLPWPTEKERAERTKAIQAALAAAPLPLTSADLAQQFTRAKADSVEEILEALTSLGLARRLRGGKYTAVR